MYPFGTHYKIVNIFVPEIKERPEDYSSGLSSSSSYSGSQYGCSGMIPSQLIRLTNHKTMTAAMVSSPIRISAALITSA